MELIMESTSTNTLETRLRPQVSLLTIFTSYFIVGLTAFGMAILQKLKALVMDSHWLSEEEMNEGLAMVQLYPGPLMVDFAAYVGYRLRGVIGAILATTGFILPSFVLMSVLSAFYFAAGNLPWVHPLFLGLEALVDEVRRQAPEIRVDLLSDHGNDFVPSRRIALAADPRAAGFHPTGRPRRPGGRVAAA